MNLGAWEARCLFMARTLRMDIVWPFSCVSFEGRSRSNTDPHAAAGRGRRANGGGMYAPPGGGGKRKIAHIKNREWLNWGCS